MGWYKWGDLQSGIAPISANIQRRFQTWQENKEFEQLTTCVNKNPNFTILDVEFIPSANADRILSIITSYTIDLSTKKEIKKTAFGEAHRVLFRCTLMTKTDWKYLHIYYTDFNVVPVIDDLDVHLGAMISMLLRTTRDFVAEVVEIDDIFTAISEVIGDPEDVPTPRVIVVDMTAYNLQLSAEYLNGDRKLAIRRYNSVIDK